MSEKKKKKEKEKKKNMVVAPVISPISVGKVPEKPLSDILIAEKGVLSVKPMGNVPIREFPERNL